MGFEEIHRLSSSSSNNINIADTKNSSGSRHNRVDYPNYF